MYLEVEQESSFRPPSVKISYADRQQHAVQNIKSFHIIQYITIKEGHILEG
jgi:hypothetical protein